MRFRRCCMQHLTSRDMLHRSRGHCIAGIRGSSHATRWRSHFAGGATLLCRRCTQHFILEYQPRQHFNHRSEGTVRYPLANEHFHNRRHCTQHVTSENMLRRHFDHSIIGTKGYSSADGHITRGVTSLGELSSWGSYRAGGATELGSC